MNKKLPLISILIPAYNHEQYVCDSLDSILNESYPNLEVIIIDDGSSDGTPKIIQEWVTKHKASLPITYISRPNKGICATLNELISLANGEYNLLFSSDDLLINDGIMKRYEYLQKNPEKLSVVADSTVIDENSEFMFESAICDLHKGNKANYGTDKGFQEEIVKKWALAGTRLDHESLYKEHGKYDESLTIDDWDFCLRLVARNQLGFMDENFTAYRMHRGSTCRTLSPKEQIEHLKSMQKTILKNFYRFKPSLAKHLIKQYFKHRKNIRHYRKLL